MARAKEFDPAAALARAIRCFRRHGYQAASMERITADMNLGRQSLYATFGDKRALFLKALGTYADDMVGRFARPLAAAEDPLAAVREILRTVARVAAAPDGRDGCLMTNSAAELGARDADVRRVLALSYRRIERAFERALRRAQARRDLARDRDPRGLARFLLATIQGLRVMGKARPEPRLLQDIVESALRCLDGDPTGRSPHAGTALR
jgi:TetR/AcrR family transcriptional repressor of nem operon